MVQNERQARLIMNELEEGKIDIEIFKALIPELDFYISNNVSVENVDVRQEANKYYCELSLVGEESVIIFANLTFTPKQAHSDYAIYDEIKDRHIIGKTHYTAITRTRSIKEHYRNLDDGTISNYAYFTENVCKDCPVLGNVTSYNIVGEPLYQEFAEKRDTRPLKRLMSKINSEME